MKIVKFNEANMRLRTEISSHILSKFLEDKFQTKTSIDMQSSGDLEITISLNGAYLLSGKSSKTRELNSKDLKPLLDEFGNYNWNISVSMGGKHFNVFMNKKDAKEYFKQLEIEMDANKYNL